MRRKGIMPQKRPAAGGEARNRASLWAGPGNAHQGGHGFQHVLLQESPEGHDQDPEHAVKEFFTCTHFPGHIVLAVDVRPLRRHIPAVRLVDLRFFADDGV